MSQVEYGTWQGAGWRGAESDHITDAWKETTAALAPQIRAATGGSGELVVAFPGVDWRSKIDVNGTYVEQEELDEESGLPRSRRDESLSVRYRKGYGSE